MPRSSLVVHFLSPVLCLHHYISNTILLLSPTSPFPSYFYAIVFLCFSLSCYRHALLLPLSLSGLMSRPLRPSHSYCPNHCYIFPCLPAPSLKKKIALFIQTTQLLQTVNTIISEWCHTKLCVCGFFLACKDCGGRFHESFPAYIKKKRKKFLVEFSSHTHIPLFGPGSVCSGLASWDNFGRTFADELRMSSFP